MQALGQYMRVHFYIVTFENSNKAIDELTTFFQIYIARVFDHKNVDWRWSIEVTGIERAPQ
jgi:hypothetical protein